MTCRPHPTPEWLLGALLREVERDLPRLRPVEQWTFHAARRSPALADAIRDDCGPTATLDAAGVVLLAGLLRLLVEQLADRGSPGLPGAAFFWQEAARLSDEPHEQQSLASARLPLVAGAARADIVDRLSAAALAVPEAARVAVLAVRGGDESELAGAMFDVLSGQARPAIPSVAQERRATVEEQEERIAAWLADPAHARDRLDLSHEVIAEATGLSRQQVQRRLDEPRTAALAGVIRARGKERGERARAAIGRPRVSDD